MITVPLDWLFAYNAVVLTGILLTNIIVIVRYSILDHRSRLRDRSLAESITRTPKK